MPKRSGVIHEVLGCKAFTVHKTVKIVPCVYDLYCTV